MAQIKQIKVGGTTYDIEPASQTALSSTIVKDALGYTPVNKAGDTMTGELVVGNEDFYTTIDSDEIRVFDRGSSASLSAAGLNFGSSSSSIANEAPLTISSDCVGGNPNTLSFGYDGVAVKSVLADEDLNYYQNYYVFGDKNNPSATEGTALTPAVIATREWVNSTVNIGSKVSKTGDTMTGDLKLSSYMKSDPSPKISVEGGVGARLDIYDDSMNGATINRFGAGPLKITADSGISIDNITVPNGTTGKTFATTDQIPDASAFVQKSGDTMTGTLYLSQKISRANQLVAGQTYHIHVDAGTNFPTYGPGALVFSSYSNLQTSIVPSIREDGQNGIMFGSSYGMSTFEGFTISNTTGYNLNNASSSFDVDVVFSHDGAGIDSYTTELLTTPGIQVTGTSPAAAELALKNYLPVSGGQLTGGILAINTDVNGSNPPYGKLTVGSSASGWTIVGDVLTDNYIQNECFKISGSSANMCHTIEDLSGLEKIQFWHDGDLVITSGPNGDVSINNTIIPKNAILVSYEEI